MTCVTGQSDEPLTSSAASSPSSSVSASPSEQAASQAAALERDPQSSVVSSADSCEEVTSFLTAQVAELLFGWDRDFVPPYALAEQVVALLQQAEEAVSLKPPRPSRPS